MDSDVRDRYKLITNIEALLDESTKLNNPATQLSISTTLALRLKMLSRQQSDPSIRNHTRTSDQRGGIGWQGTCMAKIRSTYSVSGRKAEARRSFGRPNR
jgi:hypothetical protein